jgi:hypothetical protein
VFEKRVMRRIFGRKGDEVTGESREVQNEELHSLYWPLDIIMMIKSWRMVGHTERKGEMRNIYICLVWKPGGKRPLVGPKSIWENDIKMDLIEIRFGYVVLIHVVQYIGQTAAES